jgi:hypothetical protein
MTTVTNFCSDVRHLSREGFLLSVVANVSQAHVLVFLFTDEEAHTAFTDETFSLLTKLGPSTAYFNKLKALANPNPYLDFHFNASSDVEQALRQFSQL